MPSQNPKTSKEKNRKGVQPTTISGTSVPTHLDTSHGQFISMMSSDVPSISECVYVGFSNPGQSNFDRKAKEMKAFLKRNPVPKEFMK
jgi:hypothetical protein